MIHARFGSTAGDTFHAPLMHMNGATLDPDLSLFAFTISTLGSAALTAKYVERIDAEMQDEIDKLRHYRASTKDLFYKQNG